MSIRATPFLLVFAAASARSQVQLPGPEGCHLAGQKLVQLNDRLLTAHNQNINRNPEAMKAGTQEVETYILHIVLARLSDTGEPNASAIQTYLKCMQDDDGEHPWEDITNLPQVFVANKGARQLAASGVLIMRGGNAIPQTRSLIGCFARMGTRWIEVGSEGQSYDGRTLFMYRLQSPIPEEEWYLLAGHVIGGTGGQLRLEVVGCNAKHLRVVWSRDGLRWGKVEVRPDTVELTYEKQGQPGEPLAPGQKLGPGFVIMDESDDPVRFAETLRVTPNGLEPEQ